jgi:RNA polymerase sigma factor (sigma-70 family)
VRALDTLDDAELLERSGANPEAFGVFYRRHVGAVLGYFRGRTGDPQVALDLAAETFARALEAAPAFRRGRAPATAWLYAIARNLLTDSYRRGRVEDDARRRLAMQPLILTDEGLARVEALSEARDQLSDLVLEHVIPAEQLEAIQARVVDERPYEEIARTLRCSPQVVRQRVSRGLRALRDQATRKGIDD